MTDKKVRKRAGMRLLAGLLAAGVIAVQPVQVSAAETGIDVSGQQEIWAKVPGSEESVKVSDVVLEMLAQGSIFLDETDGYLYDVLSGELVDPISGERQTDSQEVPGGAEDSGQTGTEEDTGKTEETEDLESADTSQEDAEPDNGEGAGNASVGDTEVSDASVSGQDAEAETEDENTAMTNEELIAKQQIIKLPVIVEDFRFWTVARKYAFAGDEMAILEEKKDEGARTVGTIEKDGLMFVLKEEDDGWAYVESGSVRGFVKSEDILMDEDAQELLETYQGQAQDEAEAEGTEYTGIETAAPLADELISQKENQAFSYIRATVNQTVVEKDYALVNADMLNIREAKGTDSRIVGTMEKNSLCYILADKDAEWIYIESGDVRGFVKSEYIDFGEEITTYVEENGEDTFGTASEKIKPEENDACYYTLTSVKSGVPGGEIRSSLLEFASQFIGNPYVWGGTSLTEGADCSGFVQSIYKQYGYTLPRTSREQSQYGTQIPVEDAEPGDLIFYAKNGRVYHVVLYAGDGKTIEAMDEGHGIVQSEVYSKDAVWAVRILDDTEYTYTGGGIGEVNASEDMYGEALGNFKITYYCSCERCCNVATGITATGTPVVEGRTIAVDPDVIPYGTKVIIGGHIFTAEDCGGAVKGNHIDIYVNDHAKALALGTENTEVYLLK